MLSLTQHSIAQTVLGRLAAVGRDKRWLRAELWKLRQGLGGEGDQWSADLAEHLLPSWTAALTWVKGQCIEREEYEWAEAVQERLNKDSI